MKKNIARNISILLMVPLACMCAKEGTNDNTDAGLVTIKATVDDTKVDFAQDDEKLTLSWSEGDALMVVGDNSEVYTIKPGFSDHDATFEGNAVEGSSFDVFYPASYDSVDGLISRSYTGQEQTGNANMAHLEFNALASGLTNYSEVNFGADGVLCNGVLKMVVKLPGTVTAASSISLSAPDDIFYTTNGLDEMTNTLSLVLADCTIDTDGILTAYMMTSWQDVTIEAGTKLTIEVTAPGKGCTYTKTFSNPSEISLNGGACLNIDISEATTLNHKIKGSGTEEDPYLLYDAEDMLLMNGLLVAEQVTYFKMMADIDMEGIDWVGGNQDSPFKQHIDFNGDGHKISNLTFNKSGKYSGLVGVLSGRVANVTLVDPVVSTSRHGGIVCGFAGTAGTKPAIIENVTVIRGKITQTGGNRTGIIFGHTGDVDSRCEYTNINVIDAEINQNGTGASGFIGGAQNRAATFTNCHTSGTLTISSSLAPSNGTSLPSGGIQGHDNGSTYTNCSFTGTINGGRLCGGIVGFNAATNFELTNCYVDATLNISNHGSKSSGECCGGLVGFLTGGTISNSYTKGSIKIPGQIAGGIVGNVKSMSTITNCWSSMNITADRNAAGIVARAASDSWNYSANKCLEISGCVYFGTKIDFKGATKTNGSSGSILGMTALKNVFSNCWRINDSKCTFVNTKNTVNKPVDQPDCNGSNWSVSADAATGEATQIGTGVANEQQYLFPYWGKAAEVDATVSSIVKNKSLGWDTTIWDLSGDYPTLKNNPEPVD